ncbi:CotH kinase family protein [Formosa algae]|uniref:Spore coat protein CotH n=1 Tax=Formosa algae TaxID=225843 RepID=A0A9X1CD52_9FLAO|nr:CotH kinase family protein [Formosa algae]MBP1840965.1 spore coat protein CotH [Formosa algae]MDQ0336138.1 spore coat protein CotH [Formosa algae]OEI79923.1 spore coat protein [Formosa algae]
MRKITITCFIAMQLVFMNSCSDDSTSSDDLEADDSIEIVIDDTDFEATDWTEATHSKDADPDFDEVFEDEAVKRLDLVISEDRWNSMLENMTSLYGTFGSHSNSSLSDSDEDPVFVPGEVFYNGIEWYRVGIRFKGNSSLQSSWSAGILKLSFKLDFDEFEDDYPQIDNQRFYGFKKLSLKNNYDDKSMLREKVASDVFRDAGLAVSHTAFYTVYVDHGDGPEYFGVYTLVEEVDDTVIDTQFSDNDGNLYKPDGDGASFALGTFTEDVFVKKTNEDDADYTDIEDLFTALHADNRTTDPEAWRDELETVFDTDTFLKYLAVNTVIQNWDTYGRMTHNYFLYNNPDTERLSWIPWDNNEALKDGNGQGAVAIDFSDVSTSNWPLIGYLYADDTYKAQYDTYVQDTIDTYFNVNTMQSKYSTYSSLIEPYATAEMDGYTFLDSSSDFQVAVNALNSHVVQRASVASSYLSK